MHWNDPRYIYNCHESDSGWVLWVVRDVVGNVEHLSVWLFEADEPAYYYPHIPVPSPVGIPCLYPLILGIERAGILARGFVRPWFLRIPKHARNRGFYGLCVGTESICAGTESICIYL